MMPRIHIYGYSGSLRVVEEGLKKTNPVPRRDPSSGASSPEAWELAGGGRKGR